MKQRSRDMEVVGMGGDQIKEAGTDFEESQRSQRKPTTEIELKLVSE